ncbi:Bromodomain-containing protein [Suillus fuscotomentosus]|uniref:Bromodomain-containing protein n=1 Tax=Suillus fuscotomentosus TaxID=1912939 RepID=A0AAD4HRD4_9AGAM|nr:Bromodomain-containing protein [Suillus fuscotomentosus]KAG1904739.1 Bromodomain-containing protein [Suillus fuscotomentosus]
MMKRDIGQLSNYDDVDGSRTKRQKQVGASSGQAATGTATNGDIQMDTGEGSSSGVAGLKEQGTKLWQMLKDVVNKEGYICSPAFMRLPSKRHYPDYYVYIQQPICLDDIKQKIDDGLYNSLDDIRQDFDLCFSNAKKYNQKNSPIWLDAKFMLKFVNKEYTKMTGKKPADGGDSEKKNKQPNLTRLLKARLQKVVDKADEETHRVLSNVFMEMPSKKDYPMYYTQIKRPMCIETIFKHLKRKEYQTSLDFANDVELVFSNALEFNQDHSQIWEDAIILRDYFRQLMSDMPEPHALPQYAKPPAKIKLKVPGTGAATTGPSTTVASSSTKSQEKEGTTGGSLTLRLPASGGNAKSSAQSSINQLPPGAGVPIPTTKPVQGSKPIAAPVPKPAPAPQPSVAVAPPAQVPTPLPTPAVQVAQTKAAPSPQVSTQPLQYQPTATKPQYYPNATYHQYTHPAPTPPTPAMPSSAVRTQPAPQVQTSQSVSRSPAPVLVGHRALKGVFLITKPRGRPFWLDHRDGVKSWAIRLGQGEKSISVAEIRFFGDDDETGDEEGDGNDEQPDDEEEEEEPSPRKRGRGRPPKNPKAKAKASALAKKAEQKKAQNASTPQQESILINLNGIPMNEKLEDGVWNMDLQVGSNVLEVGEKNGYVWKVYLDRVSII